jgi:hypothetical protein
VREEYRASRERPEAFERVPLRSSLARLGELRVSLPSRRAFMNDGAHTFLRESYLVTGAHFAIATNSEEILAAARNSFGQPVEPESSPDLTMRLWVDPAAQSFPPWPHPHFRGLGYLVYAGFDSENSLLLNLRRGRLVGRFSRAMARDQGYWQRVIFPTVVGFASEALGVTVLHCACAERDGNGLLLAGESGSGKSTLSLAMARNGFAFLADDWTYLSGADSHVLAWGFVTPVKLLPDAGKYFRELRNLELSISLNGECAYEVDPKRVFGVRRSFRCEPRWLVFLERQPKTGHTFVRMPPQEAAARLESGLALLPPELSQLWEIQRATIRSLVERPCWLLRYGENPHEIAQVLVRLCAESPQKVEPGIIPRNSSDFVRTGPDLTRRLTSTPYAADLCTGGRAIRLETNSPAILRQVVTALGRDGKMPSSHEPFLWRLISDDDGGLNSPWLHFSSIAADGLSLVNIGQRSFLAGDREARCAVGFLAEELLKDDKGFVEFFLTRLLSITETALGLTSGLQG